jgi:hypothetical protein
MKCGLDSRGAEISSFQFRQAVGHYSDPSGNRAINFITRYERSTITHTNVTISEKKRTGVGLCRADLESEISFVNDCLSVQALHSLDGIETW